MKRCDLTDLLVEQCAHCLGHDLPPDKVPAIGSSVTAYWGGVCAHCGERFPAGVAIMLAEVNPGVRGYCLAEHTTDGAA